MEEKKIQNKDKVKQVIESITNEDAKIIGVPIELIHFMGKLNSRGKTQKALFFAQLIYWSDKGTRNDGFIYKTQTEWSKETGLSEGQISEYTTELELWQFVETKLKKANGNPTVHYKVNMDYFLSSFQEFLRNRFRENQENQIDKNEDSLTENTTENTTNSSHSKNGNNKYENDKNEKDVIISKKIFSLYGNLPSDKVIDNFCLEERILIPENFIPTWDKQFRAVMQFPDVSIATFTEKFIRKNLHNKKRITLFQWNELWWDWIEREVSFFAVNNDELEKEQDEILQRVYNKVFQITYWDSVTKVIHRDYFYENTYGFLSKKTIDDCLEWLVENENFGCFGDYYFNLLEYNKNVDWENQVDNELTELNLIPAQESV